MAGHHISPIPFRTNPCGVQPPQGPVTGPVPRPMTVVFENQSLQGLVPAVLEYHKDRQHGNPWFSRTLVIGDPQENEEKSGDFLILSRFFVGYPGRGFWIRFAGIREPGNRWTLAFAGSAGFAGTLRSRFAGSAAVRWGGASWGAHARTGPSRPWSTAALIR